MMRIGLKYLKCPLNKVSTTFVSNWPKSVTNNKADEASNAYICCNIHSIIHKNDTKVVPQKLEKVYNNSPASNHKPVHHRSLQYKKHNSYKELRKCKKWILVC